MNPVISDHFDMVERRLIESVVVVSYKILTKDIAHSDGKLRGKAKLIDNGNLEFFEYVSESNGQLILLKYSFHWQDEKHKLIRRWDNAPHYSDLPNEPHHVHYTSRTVKGIKAMPDVFFVIDYLERSLI